MFWVGNLGRIVGQLVTGLGFVVCLKRDFVAVVGGHVRSSREKGNNFGAQYATQRAVLR